MLLALVGAANGETETQQRWVHPLCIPLDCAKNGPFVQLDDGALMAIDKNVLTTSTDGGKTWSPASDIIDPGMDLNHVGHVGQFMRTRDGAIVVVFLDLAAINFSWNDEKKAPNPDCQLEMFSIRSLDNGKTWVDKQRLLDGYNADFMGFIQASTGEVVLTVEHLVPELGRWVSCSFVSEDDGKTWKQSNLIDLGGRGHHDGAVEPTVAELGDGRLMMLIRTGLDQFWRAYSDDKGRHWRVIEPSGINASSAPGWLLRLKDGRLAFVWNQVKAEGAAEPSKGKSGGQAFEVPAAWFREELSLAFSEDDGKTWTKPVVIAREPGGQVAYPYLHEREPGVLWIFTRYTWYPKGKPAPPLAVQVKVEDFLAEAGK
ncbi:MAG: exo-alpha-sialidase [bacterium]|nr:exo-alpha-sialidase [bacterium]